MPQANNDGTCNKSTLYTGAVSVPSSQRYMQRLASMHQQEGHQIHMFLVT